MFRSKTLIHILVSLALILNGVGAVAASVVMSTLPQDAAASVESVGDPQLDPNMLAMQPGCEEHESVGSSSGGQDPTDCCEDGACGCGCAHQSLVVLSAAFLVTPAIAPASVQGKQLAAAPSPSLTRPVRPPIA